MPCVAIFQARYGVASQTLNLVRALTSAGYEVDLFLFGTHTPYVSMTGITGLRVFELDPGGGEASKAGSLRAAIRTRRRLRLALRPLARGGRVLREMVRRALARTDETYVVPPNLLHAVSRAMGSRKYLCFIGIEPVGLVWAAELAKAERVPYLYYSLELHMPEEFVDTGLRPWALKRAERRAHRGAILTLVQDPERGDHLFRTNLIDDPRVLYVPVSVAGSFDRTPSTYLHEVNAIPPEKKILLQFGRIEPIRLNVDLARAAQSLPDDWVVVMHGKASDPAWVDRIRAADPGGRVVLSTKLVPEERLHDVIASGTAALALYPPFPTNERSTGRSSEKVALYARSGVPFIAFDHTSFRSVVDAYHCGEVVRSLADLPDAAQRLAKDRDAYVSGLEHAFAEVYHTKPHLDQLVQFIRTELPEDPS